VASAALTIDCPDEAATARLGAALARALRPGIVVHLRGELGAGKTTLARALIQTLAPGTRVKSPTYTLVEPYAIADAMLYHLDLYRIADPDELEALDIRALAASDAIVLVEWPERGGDAAPRADLVLDLRYANEGRRIDIAASSPAGARTVAALAVENS